MKRSFTLNKDETFYVLKDKNPNRKDEPFKIDIEKLKFDTSAFYDYVFTGITEAYEISIENCLSEDDKSGSIVYKTIDEIAQGVLEKLKEN